MKKYTFITGAVVLSLFIYMQSVYAHCDTMDGPVVSDARKAFDSGNVNHVLKWVKAEDEGEVRTAFDLVMKVRPLNKDAKLLAENYFYDILVRIHRAGEGVSFTGVKPTGTPVDERVLAADRSLETGDLKPLEKMVPKERSAELNERFNRAMALKNFNVNDVKAGREYIDAYVQFFHYAEGEEGHGHNVEGETLHILLLSFIALSVVLLITSLIFGVLYFKSKKA